MPSFMRAVRSRRSVISCLLAVCNVPACTSWQVGTPTPAQFVEREHPERLLVTRTDSSTVTLDSPTVRGDTLVGLLAGADSARIVGIPLSDVTSVASREGSTGKTILLTAGIVVGALGVLTLIWAWCCYSEFE